MPTPRLAWDVSASAGDQPGVTLRDRVTSSANLLAAWEAIAANSAEAQAEQGYRPEVSAKSGVDRFAEDAIGKLAELREELLDGTYAVGQLYRIDIPKSGTDEKRTLRVPTVRDRIVERSIMAAVVPLLDRWMSPWSFAFRPGLSRFSALHAVAEQRDLGANCVVRADIDKCFDSLDEDLVLWDFEDRLRTHDPQGWALGLVRKFLDRGEWWNGSLRQHAGGVPQGSPLAPLLANLHLDRLDRAMANYGWPMVRYADDLLIPVTDWEEAMEAAVRMQLALEQLGLVANPESIEIMDFATGFVFLGEEVNHRYPEVAETERRSSPDRMSMYVGTQGAYVHVRQGKVTVSKDRKELGQAPTKRIARLVCFGNVTLAPSFRSYALNSGVDVTFLSRRGTFAGRLDGHASRDTRIVQAQVALAEPVRLGLAQQIVHGKVSNMKALVSRYQRRRSHPLLGGTVEALGDLRADIDRADTVDQLMGIEGAATKAYWDAFGALLPDGWEWGGRHRQPPPDPVNSLLSFGYAVLTGQVEGAVVAAGLEPGFGVFHATQGRRPSLALDLMEEYRPLIVDMVALDVLRRGKLKPESFRREEGGGVFLTEAGRKKYLAALENRMLTVFTHLPSKKRVSYRYSLFLQAQQMKSAILDGRADYEAVSWR